MFLENENCSIKIIIDETYTVESADHLHYDLVLNPEGHTHNDFYKTLAIDIDLFPDDEFRVALVGDYETYDGRCAVLEDDFLIVMQNNTISKIRVCDGSLVLYKKFKCLGVAFEIYRIEGGYIIYGEVEIIMLDLNFDKRWGFSGRDIFVSLSGKDPFELCENSIKLYDFEDNYYEIDFEGNIKK